MTADGWTRIAIAVVERNDRFLIGRRPPGTVLAGCWEFPGGKVHAGENPEDAAVRECREETGLDVQVVSRLLTERHRYDHGPLELHFFSCFPTDPRAEPRPSHRWVARAELDRYSFPEANRRLLELLLNSKPRT